MPHSFPSSSAVLEHTFNEVVAALATDPLLGVPERVRSIVAKHGAATRVVFLTARGFGSFLRKAKGQEQLCNIVAAVDDERCDTDFTYWGLPVISTRSLLEMIRQDPNLVVVNSGLAESHRQTLAAFCRQHGMASVTFEQAMRAFGFQGRVDHRVEDWGSHIVEHVDRYHALARRMNDAYSVQTLYSVLNFHLTCETGHYHEIERPYETLYFRSGLLRFTEDEKMVDCGASIGESLTGLVNVTHGRFAHSWLIEPDRYNIETLKGVMNRYAGTNLQDRITLHGYGVGDTACRVPFKHEGGHGGFIVPMDDAKPDDFIEVRTIDELIDDAPSFIKMDIEGAELDALKGARRTISTSKPKLAISAYHRAGDLLNLTDCILSMNPEYRVGLRHHTAERWDTCLYFY